MKPVEKTVHVVYWTFISGDDDNNEIKTACRREFTDLTEMMSFMEALRAMGRPYDDIVSCSKIAGSVGKPGAEAPAKDYNWYKRRPPS